MVQFIFMLIGSGANLFIALTAVSFVSASPGWVTAWRKICGAGLVMNGSTIATTGGQGYTGPRHV